MTQSAKQQRFGKCLLERVIGSGARSTVYLAWHEGLQIPVAVKVMKRVTGPQEAQSTERFVREARIAAQLSHPNIVRVYDCGERGDSCYLVLEYIEGENCRDKLDQWGVFDWQRAVQIIRQVAEGLAYASRKGIIHRDLKPENIMIDNEGNARMADLGLAKEMVTHGSSATQDGDVLGTPYYMSPEQIRQPSDVDFRADIYSLGATLHHMVVGEPPFEAATPFEIMAKHLNEPLPDPRTRRPELSAALCAVIMRCMAKDPKDRYPHYAELIRDLDMLTSCAPEEVASAPVSASTAAPRLPAAAPPALAALAASVPAAPERAAVRPVELPATRVQVRARADGRGRAGGLRAADRVPLPVSGQPRRRGGRHLRRRRHAAGDGRLRRPRAARGLRRGRADGRGRHGRAGGRDRDAVQARGHGGPAAARERAAGRGRLLLQHVVERLRGARARPLADGGRGDRGGDRGLRGRVPGRRLHGRLLHPHAAGRARLRPARGAQAGRAPVGGPGRRGAAHARRGLHRP